MNSTNASLVEYGKYLTSLISSVINDATPEKPFEGISWERLHQLAVFHNVAVLVYPAVKALDIPENILNKFKYNYNRMMAREARQEIEAQRIFSVFEEMNVKFIKLKGIVLKNSYPLPFMRTHSDVDICVSKEDRERMQPVMLELGYELQNSIIYHDEYEKDRFFIYELHSSILSPRSPFYNIFDNPFDKVIPDKDGKGYVFTDEYFYLSLIIHLHKHFVSEGCGIRLFSDLYIFEKTHPNLDFDFVRNILSDYDLNEFYDNISQVCRYLFDNAPADNNSMIIAEFVFKSGEYGSSELKRISWISSDKSANISFSDKCRYFLGNWFPGVKSMKRRYPVLEKAPVLLPVCWARRFFYTVFCKPYAFKEQHNEIKKMSSDEMKSARKARIAAGVKKQ